MLIELMLSETADPQVAQPDWFARQLSIASIVVSLGAMLRLHLESRGKRASNVPPELRSLVDGLLNSLTGVRQRAERITELNTASSRVEVEQLDEWIPQLADRRLARRLRAFVESVQRCRISEPPGDPITLTHAQLEKVEGAIVTAKLVLKRLDALARKRER